MSSKSDKLNEVSMANPNDFEKYNKLVCENADLRKLLRIYRKKFEIANRALIWESDQNNSRSAFEALVAISKVKQSITDVDINDAVYEVRERP